MMNNFGWLKELPDFRDFLGLPERVLALLADKSPPKKVDMRDQCSAIHDQGNIGSCVAQSVVSAVEFLDRKIDGSYSDMSRLMLYYEARKMIGTVNSDSGCYIRDGIKLINNLGVCRESLWPYDPSRFKEMPYPVCYLEAPEHKTLSYYRVTTLAEIKQALTAGLPVVFGISIYESFMNPTIKMTGYITMPTITESLIGGHAIYACGYDDVQKVIIFPNSWGDQWGENGIGYLPYEYFDVGLCNDMWVITTLNYNN